MAQAALPQSAAVLRAVLDPVRIGAQGVKRGNKVVRVVRDVIRMHPSHQMFLGNMETLRGDGVGSIKAVRDAWNRFADQVPDPVTQARLTAFLNNLMHQRPHRLGVRVGESPDIFRTGDAKRKRHERRGRSMMGAVGRRVVFVDDIAAAASDQIQFEFWHDLAADLDGRTPAQGGAAGGGGGGGGGVAALPVGLRPANDRAMNELLVRGPFMAPNSPARAAGPPAGAAGAAPPPAADADAAQLAMRDPAENRAAVQHLLDRIAQGDKSDARIRLQRSVMRNVRAARRHVADGGQDRNKMWGRQAAYDARVMMDAISSLDDALMRWVRADPGAVAEARRARAFLHYFNNGLKTRSKIKVPNGFQAQ